MFVIYKSEHMCEGLVTSKVSCIRRKRGQIKGLQDGNFRSQKAKSGTISCLMWNIYLYFIILKLPVFTNFQNLFFFLVKIIANAALRKSFTNLHYTFTKLSLYTHSLSRSAYNNLPTIPHNFDNYVTRIKVSCVYVLLWLFYIPNIMS
jgi:hypothetical protein